MMKNDEDEKHYLALNQIYMLIFIQAMKIQSQCRPAHSGSLTSAKIVVKSHIGSYKIIIIALPTSHYVGSLQHLSTML
jgi:hypothetical protein